MFSWMVWYLLEKKICVRRTLMQFLRKPFCKKRWIEKIIFNFLFLGRIPSSFAHLHEKSPREYHDLKSIFKFPIYWNSISRAIFYKSVTSLNPFWKWIFAIRRGYVLDKSSTTDTKPNTILGLNRFPLFVVLSPRMERATCILKPIKYLFRWWLNWSSSGVDFNIMFKHSFCKWISQKRKNTVKSHQFWDLHA